MPSGDTPTAEFKRGTGPEQLPWGEAAQVNDAVGLIPPPDQPDPTPASPQEQFLYSPTDRPQEPFSHGLPFGAGAPIVPGARETDAEIVQRVAAQVQNDPAAPKELRQFAERAMKGL